MSTAEGLNRSISGPHTLNHADFVFLVFFVVSIQSLLLCRSFFVVTNLDRWQGFARVEDIVRVELLLDAVHQAQRDGIDFHADEVPLFQPDAMLA